jgi:Ser/Thr protein kinase RdoA (MazF antagonist)
MIDPNIITSYWPLTNVVVTNWSEQGRGGCVGYINSKQGMFIYKIAGSWKTKEAIEDNLTCLEFINKNTQSISPSLLQTKEGTKCKQVHDKIIYILQCIEGQKPEESIENYFLLGSQLANLHCLTGVLPNTRFTSNEIKKNILDQASSYSFEEDMKSVLTNIPSFLDVPHVLIHCDPSLSNCIKTTENNLVLIDWDEVGTGPSVIDLGAFLIQQFVTEDCVFNTEYAQSFYAGYNSIRRLSPVEIENIFWSGILRGCFYLPFGDIQKRWRRITWSLENRNLLEKVLN